MTRDALPLLGTVMDRSDVYEIREGVVHPVTIWRGGDQFGYVNAYEMQMACEGRVPHVHLDRHRFRERDDQLPALPPAFFRLRQAVGALIREPDPDAIIRITPAGITLPQATP